MGRTYRSAIDDSETPRKDCKPIGKLSSRQKKAHRRHKRTLVNQILRSGKLDKLEQVETV